MRLLGRLIQEADNPQREFVTIRKFHIVSQNVRIGYKFMFCAFCIEHKTK